MTRPPLNHIKLRQALSLAIHRDDLIEKVKKTDDRPAYSFLPQGLQGYTPAELTMANEDGVERPVRLMSQEAREKKAKELYHEFCKETGRDSKPLVLDVCYNADTMHKTMLVAITSMWKKVLGVDVKHHGEEWKVYLGRRHRREYDIHRFGNVMDYPDPQNFLDIMSSDLKNTVNVSGFDDVAYNQVLNDAKHTSNATKRLEILHEAEQMFLDAYALIPLYQLTWYRMISPKVKGWVHNPLSVHPSRWVSLE